MTRLTRLTLRAILMLGVLFSGVLAAPALTLASKELPTDSVEAHHQCSDPQIGASATAADHALRARGNCFSQSPDAVDSVELDPLTATLNEMDKILTNLGYPRAVEDRGPTNFGNIKGRIMQITDHPDRARYTSLEGSVRTAHNNFAKLFELVAKLELEAPEGVSSHDLREAGLTLRACVIVSRKW
ncbi:hypothetical protein EV361DRAFT_897661 [Lentinula raphanica]|nr:hypothetical protein EV361DRAFT_897661 [Lentinula raphanica]